MLVHVVSSCFTLSLLVLGSSVLTWWGLVTAYCSDLAQHLAGSNWLMKDQLLKQVLGRIGSTMLGRNPVSCRIPDIFDRTGSEPNKQSPT
jgi:hypothetical membrane protein